MKHITLALAGSIIAPVALFIIVVPMSKTVLAIAELGTSAPGSDQERSVEPTETMIYETYPQTSPPGARNGSGSNDTLQVEPPEERGKPAIEKTEPALQRERPLIQKVQSTDQLEPQERNRPGIRDTMRQETNTRQSGQQMREQRLDDRMETRDQIQNTMDTVRGEVRQIRQNLQDAVADRKETIQNRMTGRKEEISDNRCQRVTERVDRIILRYDENYERHVQRYQRLEERLRTIEEQLTLKGYDTSEVRIAYEGLTPRIESSVSTYQTFIAQLEAARALECGESDGDFRSSLETARETFRQFISEMQETRQYYTTVVRPAVQNLRNQLPAAPAEETGTNGTGFTTEENMNL